MDGKFLGGMALGLVIGVVIIAYSKDAQQLVEKGKKAASKKMDEMKKDKKAMAKKDEE